MNILCTICARGGSSNLKNKNLKLVNGHPLIAYTVKQAVNSKLFKNIIISTDSVKIKNIAIKYGASSIFVRPNKLSNNTAGKLDVIKHALIKAESYFNYKYDYVCDLDVTSPLREISDIKLAFKTFRKFDSDNLFSVISARKNPYFNIIKKKNNSFLPVSPLKKIVFRRQDAPKVFEMNASIYFWKRKSLLNSNSVFLKNTSIYKMNEYAIDIDNKYDFEFINSIVKKYKKWQIKI